MRSDVFCDILLHRTNFINENFEHHSTLVFRDEESRTKLVFYSFLSNFSINCQEKVLEL